MRTPASPTHVLAVRLPVVLCGLLFTFVSVSLSVAQEPEFKAEVKDDVVLTARSLLLDQHLSIPPVLKLPKAGRRADVAWNSGTLSDGLGLTPEFLAGLKGKVVLDLAGGASILGDELTAAFGVKKVIVVDLNDKKYKARMSDPYPAPQSIDKSLKGKSITNQRAVREIYRRNMKTLQQKYLHGKTTRTTGGRTRRTAQQSSDAMAQWLPTVKKLITKAPTIGKSYFGSSKVQRQAGDATNLKNIKSNSIDIVVNSWMMMYLTEAQRKSVLKEVVRVTKSGGQIRIQGGSVTAEGGVKPGDKDNNAVSKDLFVKWYKADAIAAGSAFRFKQSKGKPKTVSINQASKGSLLVLDISKSSKGSASAKGAGAVAQAESAADLKMDWEFEQGAKIAKWMKPGGGSSLSPEVAEMAISFRGIAERSPIAGGICYAMSYNWAKRTLKRKVTSAQTYEDPRKFLHLAQEQYSMYALNELAGWDRYEYIKQRAELDGLSMGAVKKTRLTGKSADQVAEAVAKAVDRMPGPKRARPPRPKVVLVAFTVRGKDKRIQRHMMAMSIVAKRYGSYFDPNYGQATAKKSAKGADALTIGQMAGAFFASYGGVGDIVEMELRELLVSDATKLNKSVVEPDQERPLGSIAIRGKTKSKRAKIRRDWSAPEALFDIDAAVEAAAYDWIRGNIQQKPAGPTTYKNVGASLTQLADKVDSLLPSAAGAQRLGWSKLAAADGLVISTKKTDSGDWKGKPALGGKMFTRLKEGHYLLLVWQKGVTEPHTIALAVKKDRVQYFQGASGQYSIPAEVKGRGIALLISRFQRQVPGRSLGKWMLMPVSGASG